MDISASNIDNSSFNMMEKFDVIGQQSFLSGVELRGGKTESYEVKRKWRVDVEKKVIDSIVLGRD